jgi:hypothetical protein
MEITKVNESYSIKDKTDLGCEMNGNAYVEVNGSMNLHGDIRNELGESIGNFSYHKPSEGNVNVSVNVSEENRNTFTEYVDSVIESVLAKFA